MKEYKDYMDRISGGSRLKDKIMSQISKRAHDVSNNYASPAGPYSDSMDYQPDNHYESSHTYTQPVVYNPYDDSIAYAEPKPETGFSYSSDNHPKAAPKKRSRALLASLGLAVCAAGILFGLLFIPGILDRLGNNVPGDRGNNVHGSATPEPGGLETPSPSPDADTTPSPTPESGVHETPAGDVFHFNFFDNVTHRTIETSWIFETSIQLGREYHSHIFPAVDFYFEFYGASFSSEHGYVEFIAQESPAGWYDIPWPISPRASMRISNREVAHIAPGMILYADGPDDPQMSYIGGVPVMIKLYNWPGPPSMFYGTGEGQSPDHHNYRPDFPIVQFEIDFEIDGVFYLIHVGDDIDSGKAFIENLLPMLIAGPADLSVIENMETPEWGEFVITFDEARQYPGLGRFVPATLPEGFYLEEATRLRSSHQNYITLQWRSETRPDYEQLFMRIERSFGPFSPVSIDERWTYDWSYYPPRWAPEFEEVHSNTDRSWMVWSPIFAAQDLSLDLIRTRTHWAGTESGYEPWPIPAEFRVLHEHDGIVVTVGANGLSPETLWEILRDIPAVIVPVN